MMTLPSGPPSQVSAPQGRSSRKRIYLPIIAVVCLLPLIIWLTIEVRTRTEVPSASEPSRSGTSADVVKPPSESSSSALLAVPVTRRPIVFARRDPKNGFEHDEILFASLDRRAREVAEPEKLVVNLAKSRGTAYAIIRLMIWVARPEVIAEIDAARARLVASATEVVSEKTLEEAQRLDFQRRLLREIRAEFERILGPQRIRDVQFAEFKLEFDSVLATRQE